MCVCDLRLRSAICDLRLRLRLRLVSTRRETRTPLFLEDTSICDTGSAVLARLLLVFREPPKKKTLDGPTRKAFVVGRGAAYH